MPNRPTTPTKERPVTARYTRPTVKIVLTAIAALVLVSAAGARPAGKIVWHGSLSNGGKTAHVKAAVSKPSKLTYKVVASPAQKVNVYTSIVCSMGANNGNGDQGYDSTYPQTFASKLKAPLSGQIKLPFPHPKFCTVEVFSTLSKGGKLALDLIRT